MLHMKNLSNLYRTHLIETHALRNIDIKVKQGEFDAVTGPSGSGKTTFLNIAGLLEEHSQGDYLLDGVSIGGLNDDGRSKLRNEKIGFIFQGFNLIPDLNLFDIVMVTHDSELAARAHRNTHIIDGQISDINAEKYVSAAISEIV